MFKTLTFQPEKGFFAGGWPSKSAISMTVCIIPNYLKNFNEKIAFFKKSALKAHK
jgi:hypothetical protein